MSEELRLDSFTSLSMSDSEGHNGNEGSLNTFYVKNFSGSGSLGDGTQVSFNFTLTRVAGEPGPDVVDILGNYSVVIEKN